MIFVVIWVETHYYIVVFDFQVCSESFIGLSFCFFPYFYCKVTHSNLPYSLIVDAATGNDKTEGDLGAIL
jgi:hypothetical protein